MSSSKVDRTPISEILYKDMKIHRSWHDCETIEIQWAYDEFVDNRNKHARPLSVEEMHQEYNAYKVLWDKQGDSEKLKELFDKKKIDLFKFLKWIRPGSNLGRPPQHFSSRLD